MKKNESSKNQNNEQIYVSTHYWGMRNVSFDEYNTMTPVQKVYCTLIPTDSQKNSEETIRKLSILQSLAVRK